MKKYLTTLLGSCIAASCWGMKTITDAPNTEGSKYSIQYVETPNPYAKDEKGKPLKSAVFRRKQTERILSEQPNSSDLINQNAHGRQVDNPSLLYWLIEGQLYDLANALLINKYLSQDSLNSALITIINNTNDAIDELSIANSVHVLLDHGATTTPPKIIDAETFRPRPHPDLHHMEWKVEQRLKEMATLSRNPTKSLFFGKGGKPTQKEMATFFTEGKPATHPYKEPKPLLEAKPTHEDPYVIGGIDTKEYDKASDKSALITNKLENILSDKNNDAARLNQRTKLRLFLSDAPLLLLAIEYGRRDIANALIQNPLTSLESFEKTAAAMAEAGSRFSAAEKSAIQQNVAYKKSGTQERTYITWNGKTSSDANDPDVELYRAEKSPINALAEAFRTIR